MATSKRGGSSRGGARGSSRGGAKSSSRGGGRSGGGSRGGGGGGRSSSGRGGASRKASARGGARSGGGARRGASAKGASSRGGRSSGGSRKRAGGATKRAPNPAFMRPMQPDEQLAAVVGNNPMPRTEITKKLWDYIKRNNLQDAQERRMINADDRLRPLFGGKRQVSMFDMTKMVNQHLQPA